jgi:hypothetical protein
MTRPKEKHLQTHHNQNTLYSEFWKLQKKTDKSHIKANPLE